MNARVRLLLVEDHPGNARLIREMLRGRPEIEIEHLEDLGSACARLATGGLDLVLLDLGLPDSQGLATLAAVLRQERTAPIIVLTGHDDERLALEAVRAGAQDYLVKGQVDPNVLVRAIRYAVERQRLEDERRRAQEELASYSQRLEEMVAARTSALRQREAELERLVADLRIKDTSINCCLNAIALTDLAGALTYVNPSFLSLCAYGNEQEVVGRTLGAFVRLGAADLIEHLRRDGRWLGEARGVRRDGAEFDVQLVASSVREATGETIGFIASFIDVSDRKRMLSKLLSSERLAALGQLAGGVAHELRNPLTAVRNAGYLLRMALDAPAPDVAEGLSIIEREVEHCAQIISSLLDLARDHRASIHPAQVALIIDTALRGLTIPETVQVCIEAPPDLPTVVADASQLRQVFHNVLTNALQAMPEGGTLRIALQSDRDERVCVSVSDTGRGIARDALARIFDPLFTTKAGGVGLGLAISKLLLERNGGTIAARSEPGCGATFVISLPCRLLAPGGKDFAPTS